MYNSNKPMHERKRCIKLKMTKVFVMSFQSSDIIDLGDRRLH